MRPVSDRFLAALAGSHRMAARARVTPQFQTGIDPDGVEIPILGGTVNADARADVRSRLDGLETDGRRWDYSPRGLLTPYGVEAFVERGIVFGGGSVEWVSLGYFRLYVAGQADAPNGVVRIDGRDRDAGLIDWRLTSPRSYGPTTTVGAVFDDLVTEVYPDAVIVFDDATETTQLGRQVVVERDRHKFLVELAAAYGKVKFWDHVGQLRVESPPAVTDPVWTVKAGRRGVLVKLSRELNRDGAYNGVVAEGEAADSAAPARGLAVDASFRSPTYWHGVNAYGREYGKVPTFFASPLLTTDAQAAAAASTQLGKLLGVPHEITFDAIANSAIEPLDPLDLAEHDTPFPTVHVVDQLAMPLASDAPMAGTTRQLTDPSIEVS